MASRFHGSLTHSAISYSVGKSNKKNLKWKDNELSVSSEKPVACFVEKLYQRKLRYNLRHDYVGLSSRRLHSYII